MLPLCAQACCRTLEIEEKLRSVTVTAFVRRPAHMHGRWPTLLSTTVLLLLLLGPAPVSAPCCGEHDFCHSCTGATTYRPEADDKLPRSSAYGMNDCAAAPGFRCRMPELRPATPADPPVLCVSSFMTQKSRSLLNSCMAGNGAGCGMCVGCMAAWALHANQLRANTFTQQAWQACQTVSILPSPKL